MKLVLWGTGGCASSFISTLGDGNETTAFIDNNTDKQGTTFHGAPVLSPESLPALDFDVLIIASTYEPQIRAQILDENLVAPEKILGIYKNPVRCSKFTTAPHPSLALPEELLRKVDNRRWYHSIEIHPGGFTPGPCRPAEKFLDYPQTRDLTGKKVLDIGAWDGGYTFMAEKRGADVTAFDIQDPDYSGFNFVKKCLDSNAKHILGSVYDLDPKKHGTYDVVLYFGVFYHLFDPIKAFCNINNVLKDDGIMLFEGDVLDHAYNVDEQFSGMKDDMSPYTSIPVSYYAKGKYRNDLSTWFVPNMLCLKEWITSAGFDVLSTDMIETISRGYGIAQKISPPLAEHEILQNQETCPPMA